MKSAITIDNNTNIITITSGDKTLTLNSNGITANVVESEMHKLATDILLHYILIPIVISAFMLVFAVDFGGNTNKHNSLKSSLSRFKKHDT